MRVNLLKGLINQVGSITTTRRHLESLFDWDSCPMAYTGADPWVSDALLEIGPIGLRGPASPLVPSTSPRWMLVVAPRN